VPNLFGHVHYQTALGGGPRASTSAPIFWPGPRYRQLPFSRRALARCLRLGHRRVGLAAKSFSQPLSELTRLLGCAECSDIEDLRAMPHQSPVAFPIRVDKAWEVWISRAPTILLDVRRHSPLKLRGPVCIVYFGTSVVRACTNMWSARPPRRSVARSKIWSGYRCKPIVDTKSQKCGRCAKAAPRTPWPPM
jgi:hypothetical protein